MKTKIKWGVYTRFSLRKWEKRKSGSTKDEEKTKETAVFTSSETMKKAETKTKKSLTWRREQVGRTGIA